MANAPAFAATPRVGSALVPATLDLSLTAPTNVATVIIGVAAGTKIEEIVVEGVGVTVAGQVCIFLHDGTNYILYDQFPVAAATPSATVASYRLARTYQQLILPTAAWSLRATIGIAGNQANLRVVATGADF